MNTSDIVFKLGALDEAQLHYIEVLAQRALFLKRAGKSEKQINRAIVQLAKSLRQSQEARRDLCLKLPRQVRVRQRQQQLHSYAGLLS